MDYTRRLVDDELNILLPSLAAIALDGPKGVGKTETALRRSRTVLDLDNPATRARLEADPDNALTGPTPILIDEWQRLPWIWDSARRAVDAGAGAASFLLAGSSTPPADVELHSG
ncbi:MAG: AAA family ATPase, partial [Propionibacteriaceae bacterium]|nr:AAA family ATPase [Propionibacteriaceae bacterium]